jgi:hypothetical protein
MKKSLIVLSTFILMITVYVPAQMMRGGSGFMFPNIIKQDTLSGKVIVDTLHIMPVYYLEVNGNSQDEYYLNFGPIWYKPDSTTAVKPKNGDLITVIGGELNNIMGTNGIPMLIVYQINGQFWRDPFDPMWNDFGKGTHMMGMHSGNCPGYAFGFNEYKPQNVNLTGKVLVDTTYFMNLYYLDVNNDGKPDFFLNFGPWWYGPAEEIQRPVENQTISITGGELPGKNIPVVVVYKINGEVWRDSTLFGKYFGGGWMRRNNRNDRISNPFDENDFMVMNSNWWQMMGGGMMNSDSLFARMLEINPENIPNANYQHIFKGYEFGVFNPTGMNGMMQGNCFGMMNFGSNFNVRFHFTNTQMLAYMTDKNSLRVKYWNDQDNNWATVSNAAINLSDNTISFSTNQLGSYYILTSENLTDVAESKDIPQDYSLKQNYPNPFNPTTVIEYEIKNPSFVTLNVYNVLGQKVAILVNGEIPAGLHEVNFDAGSLSSGIYFYELNVEGKSLVKKMNLLR